MDDVCVLVHSSDRTRDVFEAVFRNAREMWRDCSWPRFVGFTTPQPSLYGFKSVATKGPSNWRGELADQLDALPPQIKYVLRLDDDAFASRPVDGHKLEAVVRLMREGGLAYVKLIPVARNVLGRTVEYFRHKFSNLPLRPLSPTEPYYCSLVPSIWRRDHLREILQKPGSVWEFELTVTKEQHYAVWEPALELDHLVTKGRWVWRAVRFLHQDISERGMQSLKSWLRQQRGDFSFAVFGFLGFRVRRYLNKLPRMPKDVGLDMYNLAIVERIAGGDAALAEHVKTLLSHPRTESSIKRALRVRLPLLLNGGESGLVELLKRSGGDPGQVREELEGVKRAVSQAAFSDYAGPLLGKSDREWFSL